MLRIIAYELGRGIAYRRISHPGMPYYSIYVPAALSLAGIIVFYLLPSQPQLLGKDGLFKELMAFLSILPGFYFAGLAAVATFNGAGMDNEMPAPAPRLDIIVQGAVVSITLTRRLFLTYLFSYLVLSSFVMCFMLIAISALTPTISLLVEWNQNNNLFAYVYEAIKFSFLSFISFVGASLIVTTLQGVFFLTERMHQP